MSAKGDLMKAARKALEDRGDRTRYDFMPAKGAELEAIVNGGAVPETWENGMPSQPRRLVNTGTAQESKAPGTVPGGAAAFGAFGEILVGIAKEAVDEALKGLDLTIDEEAIKAAVREHLKMLPVQKIQVGDGEAKAVVGQHEAFSKVAAYVAKGFWVYLYGPSGTGKSHMAIEIARFLGYTEECGGKAFYPVSLGPTTTEGRIFGYQSQIDGRWYAGPLYHAAKHGGLVLLDEADNTDPMVLTLLNSLLSNRIYGFANGETVTVHPDFRVIFTANTAGLGGNRQYKREALDAATLKRFLRLFVGYDEKLEKTICDGFQNGAATYAYFSKLRAALTDLSAEDNFVATRDFETAARLHADGTPLSEAAEMLVLAGLSEQKKAQVYGRL